MTVEQKATTLDLIAAMLRNGERVDCMTVARLFNQTNGTRIDHHEFAYYLDELRGKGILKISSHGYFTQYAFNK